MELENSQNNALAKLPMLKLGEYEMWEIRIKQYFQIQDYALWEVIENGNSWVPIPVTATETGPSTGLKMTVPSTAEEKICKKNDVKARTSFGGNEATKRTQKALLKLQKLVSRLAILGVVTPLEDLNVKCLDDLYNNFKIVEQKIKRSTGAINDEKNLAFLTTTGANSINNINTVNLDVSTGTTKVNTASTETSTASFSDATGTWKEESSLMEAVRAVMINIKYMEEEEIQANMALMGFTDAEAFKASTYKRGLSILEGQILKYKESEVLFSEEIALLKRSVGHKEYLMGLLKTELEKVKGLQEFKQPEVNEYGPRDSSVKPTTGCDKESENSKENIDDSLKQQQKTDSSSVKSPLKVDKDWKEKFFCPANQVRVEAPKKARENNDAPIIEDWVSDDEDDVESIPKVEKKTVIPTATKKEFVKPETPVRRSVRSVNTARPFSTARSFNTVRPSYTAHPKSPVHCARPRIHFQNQAQSTVQRPLYKRTALTKRSYNQNVNTGIQTVNTVDAQDNMSGTYPIFQIIKTLMEDIYFWWRSKLRQKTSAKRLHGLLQMLLQMLHILGDASPNIVDDSHIEDKDALHDEDDTTEESHDGSNLQNNGTADQQINTPGKKLITVQQGREKTSYSKKGFLSVICEGKSHQDLYTCLFVCFLSQEEPKNFLKLLRIPAWVEAMHEELLTVQLQKMKRRNIIDANHVFIKRHKGHIFLVQIYVDDIIFGTTKKELCRKSLKELMKDKFQMPFYENSPFFFFGITDLWKSLWCQDGDAADVLMNIFKIHDRIFDGKPTLVLWYSKRSPLELVAYTDSDYTGQHKKGKSTTRGQEVDLFPTMLHVPEPSPSPSRITSSPSHSPEHSPSPTHSPTPEHITVELTQLSPVQSSPAQPSPTQPSLTHLSPRAEHHFPIPHDLPLHTVHSHGSDEGRLQLMNDIVGRKLSEEEVQEKASTKTELFIQEVTPTEVIQAQEGSEKGSDEVSTAGAKKESKPKKKSKKELEQERLSFAEAIRLEEQMNEEKIA
ncbi:hypothetical protein Tco_1447018 [Tanacetum coccineum]